MKRCWSIAGATVKRNEGRNKHNMGTREESVPTREIKGWSGKIRPLQAEAGKCRKCQEPVFVDPHANAHPVSANTEYLHWGCS